MRSRIGVTPDQVWRVVLDGVPTENMEGQRLPDDIIDEFIANAENMVEARLDILLGTREIRCVQDQGDPDDDSLDNVVFHPALDKPKNWLAGDRQAIIKLPFRPVNKIIRVTLKGGAHGWRDWDIPVERTRLYTNGFSLDLGRNTYGGAYNGSAGWGWGLPNQNSLFYGYRFNDGARLPAGLEVVYSAGIGLRALKQYPSLRTAVLLQAGILSLSMANVKLGGGVQREQLTQDSLSNTVELQRSDYGPLGGPIRSMSKSLDIILSSLEGQLRGVTMTYMG